MVFGTELLQLAWMVRPSSPPASGDAKAWLVVDAQHAHFVLTRTRARERVFLRSHHLGPASWTGISPHGTVPVGGIRGGALRGRFDRITRLAQSQWVTDARASGVNVVPTQLDGLHAKVLAWDESALLVSSLNWLSAYPMEFRVAGEIGVWIEAPGVSSTVIGASTTKA